MHSSKKIALSILIMFTCFSCLNINGMNRLEDKIENLKRKVCSETTEFGIRYILGGTILFCKPLVVNYSFRHGYEFWEMTAGIIAMLYGLRQLKFSTQIEQQKKLQ